MRHLFLLLILTSCITSQEPTEGQAQVLAEHAATKVNAGEWTPEYAKQWLQDRKTTHSVDVESIGALLGTLLASVGAAYGIVRVKRGPSKPMDPETVAALERLAARERAIG